MTHGESFTVNRRDLVKVIGLLPDERVRETLDGVNLLLEPREVEE
jgi:hypothetical protein